MFRILILACLFLAWLPASFASSEGLLSLTIDPEEQLESYKIGDDIWWHRAYATFYRGTIREVAYDPKIGFTYLIELRHPLYFEELQAKDIFVCVYEAEISESLLHFFLKKRK